MYFLVKEIEMFYGFVFVMVMMDRIFDFILVVGMFVVVIVYVYFFGLRLLVIILIFLDVVFFGFVVFILGIFLSVRKIKGVFCWFFRFVECFLLLVVEKYCEKFERVVEVEDRKSVV